METYAILETLLVFYYGLFRRTTAPMVVPLRRIAFGGLISGSVSFFLGPFVPDFELALMTFGTGLLLLFLVLVCWCTYLVSREGKEESRKRNRDGNSGGEKEQKGA